MDIRPALIRRLVSLSRLSRFVLVAVAGAVTFAFAVMALLTGPAGAGSGKADDGVKIEVSAPEGETKEAKPGKEPPKIELSPGPERKGNPAPGASPRSPFGRFPGFFEDDDDFFGSDPFELMRRMQEDMERVFDRNRRALGRGVPNMSGAMIRGDLKVDMKEEGGNLVIRCAMPGLDKASIKVRIKDGLFSVAGETNANVEEKGETYYRREMSVGSVSRTVPLPVPVDEKKAKAKYENGVLTVTVPKIAAPAEPEGMVPVE